MIFFLNLGNDKTLLVLHFNENLVYLLRYGYRNHMLEWLCYTPGRFLSPLFFTNLSTVNLCTPKILPMVVIDTFFWSKPLISSSLPVSLVSFDCFLLVCQGSFLHSSCVQGLPLCVGISCPVRSVQTNQTQRQEPVKKYCFQARNVR